MFIMTVLIHSMMYVSYVYYSNNTSGANINLTNRTSMLQLSVIHPNIYSTSGSMHT